MAAALLLAPFLIVALSFAVDRSARLIFGERPAAPSEAHLEPVAPARSAEVRRIVARDTSLPNPGTQIAPPVRLPSLALLFEPSPPPLPSLAPLFEPPPPPPPRLTLLFEPPPPPPPRLTLLIEPPPPPLPRLALLFEPPPPPLPRLALLVEPPPPPPPRLALMIEPALPPLPRLGLLDVALPLPTCLASDDLFSRRPEYAAPRDAPRDPAAFGLALSAAAQAQLGQFVIYNPKYARIRYPMGDVPSLFGVCTDVVVRAYRALGIDLQALVQETRSGRGDRNIDHRRVEVLRRFLAKHGEVLPITDLAEDYQPGDIVTYYRPQNRSSTSHIAIVTDRLAPSGRLMIVHNRGWGPQLEDALFVDKITGHYRFSGLKSANDTWSAKRHIAKR